MSTFWMPSGFLDDGTALFGPLKKHPGDTERVVEVDIEGQTWFIRHSGLPLSTEQKEKLQIWVKTRLALSASRAAKGELQSIVAIKPRRGVSGKKEG